MAKLLLSVVGLALLISVSGCTAKGDGDSMGKMSAPAPTTMPSSMK